MVVYRAWGGGVARRHWRNGRADGVSRCTKMPMTARCARALALLVLAALAACTSPPPPAGPESGAPATAGPTTTALDAYRGYMRVADAARRSPLAEDWATRFAEYSVDPELSRAVEQWQRFRDLGVVFFGDTLLLDTQVVEQSTTAATISDCLDASDTSAQQNGRVLPNDPTQARRGRATATLVIDGLEWKVADLELLREEPC